MSNVYVIENTSAETPTAYVGKANDPVERLEQHFRTASDPRKKFLTSHLTNAIKKHGKHSFVLHVVETDVPETLAFQLEREWISYLGSMGVRLYKSSGGCGGQKRATQNQQERNRALLIGSDMNLSNYVVGSATSFEATSRHNRLEKS